MRLAKRLLLFGLILIVPASILAGLAVSWLAAIGIAAGMGVAMFSIGTIALTSALLAGSGNSRLGGCFAVVAWFLKLPIIGLVIYWLSREGTGAVGGFLFGLGLVYSLLIYLGLRDARAAS